MGSYLNIYLEKKKKEGEEKGERLLLCTISRANDLYSLFYNNNIYNCTTTDEDGRSIHEFDSSSFNELIEYNDQLIAKTLLKIAELKEVLPLITDKDSINDLLDQLSTNKEYFQELMTEKATLNTLSIIFSDINTYSDFDKLYWKID